MASRKKTDSRPSRATAKNTIPISAHVPREPPPSATSIDSCSSDLIERAALRIQNTIETSTVTAMAPTIASKSSCPFCGNSALANCRAAPTSSEKAMASRMPIQTAGIHADRPVWRR